MNPLNPHLYKALVRVFNRVKVADQGTPMSATSCPDWSSGKPRLYSVISVWGESYLVCCPVCVDTRSRLYINHRWAQRDRETGDDNLHLVKCFNEDCLSNRQAQKRLHALVYPDGRWADEVEPLALRPLRETLPALPQSPTPAVLPASQRLDELHPLHPVLAYLRKRGFDPAVLARDYGVRYCERCTTCRPALNEGRIVIPIRELATTGVSGQWTARLAGWQARVARFGVPDGTPKYLTAAGMHKSRLLYGLPMAVKTTGPVVIVEGITDVWKIGKGALAVLGKTISHAQCELILSHLRGRPVVVWLDEDAESAALRMAEVVRTARAVAGDHGRVVVAHTPAGRDDPGECTPEEVGAVLKQALAE